jgi:hypothetical protein
VRREKEWAVESGRGDVGGRGRKVGAGVMSICYIMGVHGCAGID